MSILRSGSKTLVPSDAKRASAVAADPEPYDPFSGAEAAAADVIGAVLQEGATKLYDAYIHRKSFPYMANSVTELLVEELRLCYVRHDEGPLQTTTTTSNSPKRPSVVDTEEDLLRASISEQPAPAVSSFYGLEEEPPRCIIDNWARSCVPIKKKTLTQQLKGGPGGLAKKMSFRFPGTPQDLKIGGSPNLLQLGDSTKSDRSDRSSRLPSRMQDGMAPQEESLKRMSTEAQRAQIIPLIDEKEEDEEEAYLREMKDREARRKREEESRQVQKAKAEEVEAEQQAKQRDQMKNKPFTNDSAGNPIWIVPPQPNKLPNAMAMPSYACKIQPMESDEVRKPSNAGTQATPRASHKRTTKKLANEKDFTDGFKRFVSQQPPMMEVMVMAPGVGLTERGQQKKNEQPTQEGMSRKDYDSLVQRETASNHGSPRGQAPAVDMDLGDGLSPAPSVRDFHQGMADDLGEGKDMLESIGQLPSGPRVARDAGPRLKVVRGPDQHANLIPHAPTVPRPVQGVTPAARRAQLQRDALGFGVIARERGKLTGAVSYGTAYIDVKVGDTNESPREPFLPEPVAAQTKAVPDGMITSSNPAIARRLFPR